MRSMAGTSSFSTQSVKVLPLFFTSSRSSAIFFWKSRMSSWMSVPPPAVNAALLMLLLISARPVTVAPLGASSARAPTPFTASAHALMASTPANAFIR